MKMGTNGAVDVSWLTTSHRRFASWTLTNRAWLWNQR